MHRTNVVLVLLDDFGWKDSTCYGSTFYETPNLDKLASQGMRFTDAYASCPVCSPTRASLLTGKYPARVGVTNWIDHSGSHPNCGKLIDVPYVKHLPLEEHTLASALRDADYQTWHVGKWHLGLEPYWPKKQGFDVNIGGC
ncbi:sulfatase-like hydrolase/transferase, partial [bacterium AH-315-I18]|nr:sulfatase-like hydrolase/transferase [bacterium AH-315-I18]